VLGVFNFGIESCGYMFSVKSYCGLAGLLVCSNLKVPARLLLIGLTDGKMPTSFEKDISDRHVEIAMVMVDMNVGFENDDSVGV